jgi:NADH-quinone oxidoreductase subunit N
MRKMYMEDAPDMRRVKEPRAIVAVLVFAVVFMVGFGIWHAPLLDFASKAVPNLTSSITQASTATGGVGVANIPQASTATGGVGGG